MNRTSVQTEDSGRNYTFVMISTTVVRNFVIFIIRFCIFACNQNKTQKGFLFVRSSVFPQRLFSSTTKLIRVEFGVIEIPLAWDPTVLSRNINSEIDHKCRWFLRPLPSFPSRRVQFLSLPSFFCHPKYFQMMKHIHFRSYRQHCRHDIANYLLQVFYKFLK